MASEMWEKVPAVELLPGDTTLMSDGIRYVWEDEDVEIVAGSPEIYPDRLRLIVDCTEKIEVNVHGEIKGGCGRCDRCRRAAREYLARAMKHASELRTAANALFSRLEENHLMPKGDPLRESIDEMAEVIRRGRAIHASIESEPNDAR